MALLNELNNNGLTNEDCGCDKRQEQLNKYPSILNKLKGKK